MKLYDEVAAWWPLFSPPSEYEEEAREAVRALRAEAKMPLREVLELGSGGGNNASFMKADFALTLVEPADGMRGVSQKLNPECAHFPGDMRTVRLGRTFDAVFVHDAIMYMTTEADLLAAFRTVAAHLAPGGVALITPDATAETFDARESTGGADEPPAPGVSPRGVRFLEWVLPIEPGAMGYEVHYAVLLRDRDGTVTQVHDVHHEGLFPRATWLRLLAEAGIDGRLDTRVIEGTSYDVFVGTKMG